MMPGDAPDLNGKILDYIAALESRIALLREPPSDVESLADVRLTCEAIADSLELVTRELTDLLVIR